MAMEHFPMREYLWTQTEVAMRPLHARGTVPGR
jgi:hypothetical protein